MTVFIDVWTLYSGIREYGLCPDYILVEFVPNWSYGMRPAYDRNGRLEPNEYFRKQPMIKCKHKCNKWGMKSSSPDPYLQLSLGKSVFAQAVRWDPLRRAFQKESLGLKITSSLRTDGDDRLPEGWPQIELPEEYSEEYREHIYRRYALSRLGSQYDEPDTESLLQWILDDLNARYERALEMETIDRLSPQEAEVDLVEDVYEYEISTRGILEEFVNKSYPETYRLGSTNRLLLQSGRERESYLGI